jgi:hypothetical protein
MGKEKGKKLLFPVGPEQRYLLHQLEKEARFAAPYQHDLNQNVKQFY